METNDKRILKCHLKVIQCQLFYGHCKGDKINELYIS